MTSTSFELKTFQRIPLYALSVQSRDRLASYLDAIKILPTSDGYCRDWRGLFQISGFCNQYMSFFESKTYPTKELIKTLEKVPDPETFTGFRGMLEKIDRYDVLDDTYELFVADALKYLEKQATVNRSQQQYVNTNMIPEKFSKCLTVDDFALAERGLPLQKYDAFILYADKDVKFAKKMVTKLEESGLKLCVKDRDFLVGLPFEHDAIRTLLTERCGRLVVILSPDFLASPLNTYTSNLAQWLGITQETRKLIPCIYRPCELPNIFHGINVLNYQKLKIFNNFWERLVSSLQTTSGRGITYPRRYNNNMDQMSVQQDMQRLTDSWAWSLKRYVSKHFSVRSANSVGSSVWSNRSSRRRRTSEQLTSSLDQYPCPPNSAISSDRLSEDMSLSTDSFDRIYGTFGGSTPGTSSSGSLYSTDSLSSGSR